MKVYLKEEVDEVFHNWKGDLAQLTEIDAVSIEKLYEIRREISNEMKNPSDDIKTSIGVRKALLILDKNLKELLDVDQ